MTLMGEVFLCNLSIRIEKKSFLHQYLFMQIYE